MPLPIYYQDHAVVRLTGPVTTNAMFELADEIDLARTYYRYPGVTLLIDSPGGDVRAMVHFLDRLREWRRDDRFTLGTVALTTAASAAAVLLFSGSPGHRLVRPNARVLLHFARMVSGSGEVWTREMMNQHAQSLGEIDDDIVEQLATYIFSQAIVPSGNPRVSALQAVRPNGKARFRDVDVTSVAQYAGLLRSLARRDMFLSAEQAVAMRLVDRVAVG